MKQQEYSSLNRELNSVREQLLEREEEISELKAERNNTRLLLEHLECLVSRHERSLRMTVVKRQAQSPAGVSSEVEVLKALKSLFEHHKALDEKVREKLRVAVERASQFEDDLNKTKEEISRLRQEKMQLQQQISTQPEIISNGHVTKVNNNSFEEKTHINNNRKIIEESEMKVMELKSHLDQKTTDLVLSRSKISELTSKIEDLEDALKASEEVQIKIKDENLKLLESLRENNAQKEDQEERISTLEKRYLNSQRESTSLHDLNEKLEHELASREAQVKMCEEKINALSEKLELAEERLSQMEFDKRQEALMRESAASAAQESKSPEDTERQISFEERMQRLEAQLDEKSCELLRARQREKMNEEHNHRLSATVDKLLAESNDRLQLHLQERMASLEEKNTLNQDLERTRRLLEETQAEKEKISSDLTKIRHEMDSLRSELQKTKAESIQAAVTAATAQSLNRNSSSSAKPVPPVPKRNMFRDPTEWTKGLGISVNSQPSFETVSDTEFSDANESMMGDGVLLSPTGHTDAQALALMLQEQLDAINNEIRLIQEEKQTTEQRAEELESQVGSIDSSMSGLLSRNRTYEPLPLAGVSPPGSGRSTPSLTRISPSRDYMSHLYNTVSIIRTIIS